MNDIHKSFLEPFFKEMNAKFKGSWCVLHSYETLPDFSSSDVDMAFSNSDIKGLENLIYEVAVINGWEVLQKLWYDIESCFYYIVKDKKNDVYLALDFLIDNKGIGRYGFKTTILTNKCRVLKELIPVPNQEVAFCYKFVKRIVKKGLLIEDVKYLDYHYSKANKEKLMQHLEGQFGSNNLVLINKYLKNKNYTLKEADYATLLKKRDRILRKNNNEIVKQFWKLKRIINRIFYPSGLIVHVPILQKKDLETFSSILEKKIDIAFRFVKLNKTNSLVKDAKWLSGSTLVIHAIGNLNSEGKIRWGWFKKEKIKLNKDNLNDTNLLADIYKEEIIKILALRNSLRRKL